MFGRVSEGTMSTRLTAMDIEKQVFTRKMRGFDPDEVQLFLRAVAEEIEDRKSVV